MILYLDTSALVKKYFKEPGSIEVIAKWKQATEIATSSVAYAELTASVYRKQRELFECRASRRPYQFVQKGLASLYPCAGHRSLTTSIDGLTGLW